MEDFQSYCPQKIFESDMLKQSVELFRPHCTLKIQFCMLIEFQGFALPYLYLLPFGLLKSSEKHSSICSQSDSNIHLFAHALQHHKLGKI